MAEFNFFASWPDTLNMLGKILNTKLYKIIIHAAYEEPIPTELKSISENEIKFLKKNHSVFLWSEAYSFFPIKFWTPDSHAYTGIYELESGPVLHLSLADIYQKQERFRVGAGRISYSSYFIHPETHEKYSPPESLKQAFKSLKSLLQKDMVKRYWPHTFWSVARADDITVAETLWIGSDAMKLLERENHYILWGQDTWLSLADLVVSRG